MSNNALLSNLKGYSRTFAVRSNSPYAAAAAMGLAMGRAQQLCPYFNFVIAQTCRVNVEAVEAIEELAADNLKLNFMGDWTDFLRQNGLPGCGLRYDESRRAENNTMRYLNAHNRRIPIIAPRTVHESRELSVPQEYESDYSALKALITSGGDLKPHLSRDILKKKRADKNDGLLNASGIQHLHFRATHGTSHHILLCKITATDAFIIQAVPHVHDVWVDTSVLQILHDNWPEEMMAGKCHGIEGEAVSSSGRLALRNQKANVATAMVDGTVYLAPGGGLMASGDCFEDRSNCDKIFAELTYWQGVVKSNGARFRAALRWPPSKDLSIKMAFDHRDCWLYEPTN
jgi:hypothetical protein